MAKAHNELDQNVQKIPHLVLPIQHPVAHDQFHILKN